MNNTIPRLLLCLILSTSLTINALQAQYDQVGQVIIQKGTLSVYEWNNCVMCCEAVEMRTGIPAELLLLIPLLETGFYSSEVYNNSFNAYGILGYRDWSDKPIYEMPHKKWNAKMQNFEMVNTPFRKYSNLCESIYDFPRFISHDRYAKAWDCGEDVPCWLQELQAAGYSEDSNWATKILKIRDRYKTARKIFRSGLGK